MKTKTTRNEFVDLKKTEENDAARPSCRLLQVIISRLTLALVVMMGSWLCFISESTVPARAALASPAQRSGAVEVGNDSWVAWKDPSYQPQSYPTGQEEGVECDLKPCKEIPECYWVEGPFPVIEVELQR